MIVPAQIRMARAALNWSGRDLAKAAGVHHNTIGRIERGEETNKGTLLLIQKTLEEAGIEFLNENDSGPGVRLRKTGA
jgi:transcriptional regulator with XRE-family HTH domain